MKIKGLRLRFVALIVAGLATAGFFYLFFAPSLPAPSVELLPGSIQLFPTFRDNVERTLLTISTNAAFSRVQNAVFGNRNSVSISGSIHSAIPSELENIYSKLPIGYAPFLLPDRVQILFLPGMELDKIQNQILTNSNAEHLGEIRIITTDGFKSSVFTGGSIPVNGVMTDVGQSVECVTKTRKTSSELLLQVLLSEFSNDARTNTNTDTHTSIIQQPIIQTNLHLSLKLGIPHSHGLMILRRPPINSDQQATVIILKPLQ